MSKIARLIASGILGRGGSNGVPLPYTYNPSGEADGALPAPWSGAAFAIATNVITVSPTAGAEDISNGNMETGDPPTGWSSQLSAVLASIADERTGGAGAAALSVTNNGATYGGAYQTLGAADGTWMLIDGWVKRVTSANAQILLQTSGGTTITNLLSTTADTWVNQIFTGYTSGANCKISLLDSNTSGGEYRFDDVSAKPLTTADLFATLPTASSSVTASVVIPTTPGAYQGGLLLNLDSITNPQNYVVAYLTTAHNSGLATVARLTKCVNGVISNVITGSVTYGATKYLKVVKDGDDYSLYYGTTDVQVGTTQVIASMNGTIHGLFGTGGGSFGAYSLEATPANP